MTELTKKKILITGASSFLGRDLTNMIRETYEIFLLIHKNSIDIDTRGINIVNGSIEEPEIWEKEIPKIDIILHLAAITHSKDPQNYTRINNIGTQRLINFGKSAGVYHFIFISTRAIGSCCGSYGESKKIAEEAIKKYGINHTILRVGEVYEENFIGKEGLNSLQKLIKRSFIIPYPAKLNNNLAPIHKEDVLRIIVNTIENPKTYNKTYTVCGPENLKLKEVLVRMCKNENKSRLLLPIPFLFIKIPLIFLSRFFNIGTPDQLQRFVCKKDLMSPNLEKDLSIKPRRFLPFS